MSTISTDSTLEEYPDFSVDDMLELWKEGSYDDCRKRSQIVSCDMYGWDYVDEGDWTQDHKYQNVEHVIQHLKSGRCFMVFASRSGSYHTDWYYTYDNAPIEVKEVKRVVTLTEWEPV